MPGRFEWSFLAGTDQVVDLFERIFLVVGGIFGDGVFQHLARDLIIVVDHLHLLDLLFFQKLDQRFGELFVGQCHRFFFAGQSDVCKKVASLGIFQFEGLALIENLAEILVGGNADRPQQDRDRQFAPLVDMHIHHVMDVDVEFQPGAVVGDHLGRIEGLAAGMLLFREKYARGALQL